MAMVDPFSLDQYLARRKLLTFITPKFYIYDTMGNTLAQTIAPEAMRGRVSGFYTLMMSGVQIGAFGMGGVAEVRGIAFAVGLGGSLVAGNAIRLAPLAWRLTERSAMQSKAGPTDAASTVPQTEDR